MSKIAADESRTFSMANVFKQVGIHPSAGQRYEPEDIGSVLSYREAMDGQILEEGIFEAGAIASWTAAATSSQPPCPTAKPMTRPLPARRGYFGVDAASIVRAAPG